MTTVGRAHLLERPDISVARVNLGVHAYLSAPHVWSQELIADLARRFGRRVGVHRLPWFVTSRSSHWRPVDTDRPTEILEHLRNPSERIRHLFRFRWADDRHVPLHEFSYREVDDQRSSLMGHLRISLPADSDPALLLEITRELAALPVWCVTAGYLLGVNPLYGPEGYTWALRWTRRCHGLHVSAPDIIGKRVREGLPGVGWLNYVSDDAANAWGMDHQQIVARGAELGVVARPEHDGLWVQSGAMPELGDANQLAPAIMLGRTGQLLGPYLLSPPPLPEPFGERVTDWMMRFTYPERWA